jgi:hypothetical protein
MGYSIEAVERRRQIIRIILFFIILGTLPFYCAGFVLWGTAKPRAGAVTTPFTTNTPIGNDVVATDTLFPTLSLVGGSPTSISPLRPTPLQFIPPSGGGAIVISTATFFVQPFIPSATLAPTLTLIPTSAPLPTVVPPTSAPLPTDIPLPTSTPIPTDTPVPPTDTPVPTDAPIPTDVPTDVPTATP